jgi:hypothetical protein
MNPIREKIVHGRIVNGASIPGWFAGNEDGSAEQIIIEAGRQFLTNSKTPTSGKSPPENKEHWYCI